jgi:ParB-like nuclease domain
MAVDFKVEHTRTSEYLFLPQDITFKPELNGRTELPDIEWIVKSFLERGQIQPILVSSDGGVPVLRAGFSRWRAAVEINKRKLTPVPFKLRCVYLKASEQEGFLANIAENLERNNTTAIDDAHNMARMERYGMTIEQIAEFYHPKDELGRLMGKIESVKWAKDRMAMITLSPESVNALRSGKIRPNAVSALAKLSEEQQRRALESSGPITKAALKASNGNGAAHKPKKSTHGIPGANISAVNKALCVAIETGELPGGLDVLKMRPEDAVYAVCGVLLDLLNGKKAV